jgi:hypothetical protein
MPGRTCEICGNAAVFVIREMEGAEARERHLCATHALDVDPPPGTYVLENRSYASFADLVAAVGMMPAAGKLHPHAHVAAHSEHPVTPNR